MLSVFEGGLVHHIKAPHVIDADSPLHFMRFLHTVDFGIVFVT